MKRILSLVLLVLLMAVLAACVPLPAPANPPTPTVNLDDIYNHVPDTTVYDPGECTATLKTSTPAYTSNTLGGQSSGEIPAGQYGVGVVADYGSSLWFMLDYASTANWVNSASVSALTGVCAADNPLANTRWQVTDYADPGNTTGMTTVLLGTNLTVDFSADNKIGGSAGCNAYSGSYQLDGQSLTIPGPLAMTMKACAEDVMAQETVFLTNLQAVAGYKLDNVEPQLHLLNGKGQVIILLRKQ
jgi:heat shock protein HslJ